MKTLKQTLMILAVILLIGLMSCEKEPTTKCYTCTTTVQYNFLTNNNDGTWSKKYGTINVTNSTVFCDLTSGEAAILLPQYEKDNSVTYIVNPWATVQRQETVRKTTCRENVMY